jgi:hypothetical protein
MYSSNSHLKPTAGPTSESAPIQAMNDAKIFFPHIGFELLSVLTMNNTVCWVVTPFTSERIPRFGGTYRLYLSLPLVSAGISLDY